VNCFSQIIPKSGRVTFNPNGGINIEVLPILPLKIKDAVVRKDPQASNADFVLHG
jgi:hypothetical protein